MMLQISLEVLQAYCKDRTTGTLYSTFLLYCASTFNATRLHVVQNPTDKVKRIICRALTPHYYRSNVQLSAYTHVGGRSHVPSHGVTCAYVYQGGVKIPFTVP